MKEEVASKSRKHENKLEDLQAGTYHNKKAKSYDEGGTILLGKELEHKEKIDF